MPISDPGNIGGKNRHKQSSLPLQKKNKAKERGGI